MKIKLLFLSIGAVIALLLLELSLFLMGEHYLASKVSQVNFDGKFNTTFDKNFSYELYQSAKDSSSIITIGDSFTNAGNAASNQSYPYVLKGLLSGSVNKTVINMGMCEDSTINTYRRLSNFLSNYPTTLPKLEKVIVLVGTADYFEPFRYNFRKDHPDGKLLDIEAQRPWYYKYRTYKLYRYFKFHFLHGETSDHVISEDNIRTLNQQFAKLLTSLSGDQKAAMSEFKRISDNLVPQFEKYCRDLGIDITSPPYLLQSLAVFMMKHYNYDLKYDQSVSLALKIIRTVPNTVWSNEFDELHYLLIQSFRLQSKVSPQNVVKIIEEVKTPKLKKNVNFMTLYKFMRNYKKQFDLITKSREESWRKLHALSIKYDFELIAATYPSNYNLINNSILDQSKKLGIKLIDLNSDFKEFHSSALKKFYFIDDDHMTPLGYSLMAKKIFNYIQP